MSACILSIVNMHDANAIVKNLIPNISNKGQTPLIPKGYRRPILKIEHMTWTYDPKPDPKGTLKVRLTDTDASISIFYVCGHPSRTGNRYDNIDANISIFHIYYLATSCLIAS